MTADPQPCVWCGAEWCAEDLADLIVAANRDGDLDG